MKELFIRILILVVPLASISCTKEGDEAPVFRYYGEITIDGWKRTYLLNLPPTYYSNDVKRPLVLALHGTGGSADQFEQDYSFTEKANREGFVVVYPEGVRKQDGILGIRTWNAGSCCDFASYSNIADTKFISTLTDTLCNRFSIDRSRIYVVGMSNGGMMAYRLAAELPGKFAAIASVSGNMVYPTENAKPAGVPLLHIHSELDTKVPFNGGAGLGNVVFPPAIEGIHYFAAKNACDTNSVVEVFDGYVKRSWRNGSGITKVECYLTADGGHAWPGSRKARPRADTPSGVIPANDLIWEFFSRFSIP